MRAADAGGVSGVFRGLVAAVAVLGSVAIAVVYWLGSRPPSAEEQAKRDAEGRRRRDAEMSRVVAGERERVAGEQRAQAARQESDRTAKTAAERRQREAEIQELEAHLARRQMDDAAWAAFRIDRKYPGTPEARKARESLMAVRAKDPRPPGTARPRGDAAPASWLAAINRKAKGGAKAIPPAYFAQNDAAVPRYYLAARVSVPGRKERVLAVFTVPGSATRESIPTDVTAADAAAAAHFAWPRERVLVDDAYRQPGGGDWQSASLAVALREALDFDTSPFAPPGARVP